MPSVEAVAKQALLDCGHVDRYAANPGKWAVCLDCVTRLLTEQARAKDAEIGRAREQIADLVNQFAVPGTVKGITCRTTGGLSDLESAFEFLGLPDPCPEAEWQERLRAAAQERADG